MEPVYEVRSLLLVEVGDHLGVAARRERVPGALQVGAQLAVVVDLAVEDDGDGAVLVEDRLIAGREVDHAQPLDPKPDAGRRRGDRASPGRGARAHSHMRSSTGRSTGRPSLLACPTIPHTVAWACGVWERLWHPTRRCGAASPSSTTSPRTTAGGSTRSSRGGWKWTSTSSPTSASVTGTARSRSSRPASSAGSSGAATGSRARQSCPASSSSSARAAMTRW